MVNAQKKMWLFQSLLFELGFSTRQSLSTHTSLGGILLGQQMRNEERRMGSNTGDVSPSQKDIAVRLAKAGHLYTSSAQTGLWDSLTERLERKFTC